MEIQKTINITFTLEDEEDRFDDMLIIMELLKSHLQATNKFALYTTNTVYPDVAGAFEDVDFAENKRYISFRMQEGNPLKVLTDNVEEIKVHVEEENVCLCEILFKGF